MNDANLQLNELCRTAMERLSFSGESEHEARLELELSEIKKQEDSQYLLKLYEKGIKTRNIHNSLVCYLLGICNDFDIERNPAYTDAEFPDIDVDFLPIVRTYLKDEWVPKRYGEQYVSNISNYNTFGLKSSLLDIARVLGEDRSEILNLTTRLGVKDDEGDPLTWDSAQHIYKELATYLKEHPKLADVASHLVHADIDWDLFGIKNPPHRKRGMGMHASGLIISSVPLSDYIPMVVSSGNREKGLQASAWVEGLADTDLSSVGFIKFDFLSLNANAKIAECNKLIRERYGLDAICSKDGKSTWSDISYLNDPKALEMANRGDLKGIFQFDSDGIRKLVRSGGVASFDDLAAYTAIYRPGPMDVGMHDEYCNRKHGKKEFVIPECVRWFLDKTYGILVYQEDVMRYLNIVGKIPLHQCQGVIKAISKKKVEKFKKYQDDFIKNAQTTLNISEEQAKEKWAELESFAGYGFNLCMTTGTLIPSKESDGVYVNKEIQNFISGDVVLCVDEEGNTVETKVLALHYHGLLEGYKVLFDDGYEVICTLNHKFLTSEGQKSLQEIIGTNSLILCDPKLESKYAGKKNRGMDSSMREMFLESKNFAVAFQRMYGLPRKEVYNRHMDGSLWSCVQKQSDVEQTSAELYRLSKTCMENTGNRWACCCYSAYGEMRHCFGNMEKEGISSERLCKLRKNQTRKYQSKEFKDQSFRRTSASIIQNCTFNFCSTRNSKSKGRTFKTLAGSQSRKTCCFYRSSMEKYKGFQDGKMASDAIGLGNVSNKMWQRSKASRFSKRQYLDRGRWILSFQRKSSWKKTTFSYCSATGCNVKQRSNTAKKCYVASFRNGLFCKFNRGDENRMVGDCATHAPISDTRRLVSRKVVRVVPVGKRQMYDLEVAATTHNFLLPNGIVTSNSHATAYTYISSRQLWQKAHYPLEFFCEDLSHLKTADERIRIYIDDARNHGIKVNKLDLNKSGISFSIVNKEGKRNQIAAEGDEIYYGFGKIKGIGEEAAQRIVDNQPYTGLEDFLQKFGTEAKVVQPLIALRLFEGDPLIQFKYYEYFKKAKKHEDDRARRYDKSISRYQTLLKQLVPKLDWITFDEVDYSKARPYVDVGLWRQMELLKKKYDRCVNIFQQKSVGKDEFISFEEFDAGSLEIEKDVRDILKNKEKAEVLYYGFEWDHPLFLCENYNGQTWEEARLNLTKTPQVLPVEVLIKSCEVTQTKTGKNMLKLRCEDGNRQIQTVTVWSEELLRFEEDLQTGACVRLRVKIDKMKDRDGYWYNLESFLWNEKHKVPKNKSQDFRVFVLKAAPKKEEINIEEIANLI